VSKVDDPDPARAARFLARLVGDAESDRVMTMTDEELLAELKAEGREPARPESTEALVARLKARSERGRGKEQEEGPEGGERAASVTGAASRRVVLKVVSSVAAAAVVVVVVSAAVHREDFVGSAPDDHEKAEAIRREAFGKCEAKDWQGCAELLNRAAAVDPAGEREQAVKKARGEIDRGLRK
jgi:hypothetical protein